MPAANRQILPQPAKQLLGATPSEFWYAVLSE